MEDRPRIALVCEDRMLIKSLIKLIHNHIDSTIIIYSTEEEVKEQSMYYQPWSESMRIESREDRYYDEHMKMIDANDNAFAQSVFVNKLEARRERKNRKNDARVQFRNEMTKFNNRRRR